MSTSTLTRPTSVVRDRVRTVPAAVGSYVDTDGVRRAPVRTGSYTGTASVVGGVVGSYTGRPSGIGSYVRSER